MPLVRAVIDDSASLRLRLEAVYLVGLILESYSTLVSDKLTELISLLISIRQCRIEFLEWADNSINTVGPDSRKSRPIFGLYPIFAIRCLVIAAFKNASKQVLRN